MDQLRENAVDRVGMQERDLEPEQTLPRLLVDELDALFRELADRGPDVGDLVGDVQSPIGELAEQGVRSEEHTSELQSHSELVCRLLLEKKKTHKIRYDKRNKN